jgi:hypothetical protein
VFTISENRREVIVLVVRLDVIRRERDSHHSGLFVHGSLLLSPSRNLLWTAADEGDIRAGRHNARTQILHVIAVAVGAANAQPDRASRH